ncbi:DUF2142 domain-containing protein [Candidatus Nomurabacteria bacterium]|nr:DUF2142 domain-containing protein [Candidatus Nomurabacteria bacterium]
MKSRYNWHNIFSKPERYFVLVAIIFGFIFIFLTPPFQGPDEQAHFSQVYRYSEGKLSPSSDLPRGVVRTFKAVFYEDDIRFKANEKYDLRRTKRALLNIPLEQNIRVNGAPYSGTTYSPIVYLPQIAVVFVGRLVNMPVILLLYMARVASLASFITLMYLAIKYISVARWPLFVAGIIPMSLFSASMVSSDSVTLGASALFIALIIGTFTSKSSMSRKSILVLIFATILLAMTKLVSMVLLPILLLIVLKKNLVKERRKALILALALLGIGLLTAIAWQVIASANSGSINASLPQHVVPAEQIKLIILEPQKFLFALWNTYFYSWGDSVAYSFIGTFGWADTTMALPFVITGYTILVLTFLANRAKDAELLSFRGKSNRIVLALVILLYVIGVNAAMFVFYSPVDFNIIVGVQGRYFIPALFLLAVFAANSDQLVIKEKAYKFIVKIMPILLLSVSALYIFFRFYIDTRI